MKKSHELADQINKLLVDAGVGENTNDMKAFDESMNAAITALALVTGRYLNHFVMIRSLKTGVDPLKLIRASADSVNEIIEQSATHSVTQVMEAYKKQMSSIKRGH